MTSVFIVDRLARFALTRVIVQLAMTTRRPELMINCVNRAMDAHSEHKHSPVCHPDYVYHRALCGAARFTTRLAHFRRETGAPAAPFMRRPVSDVFVTPLQPQQHRVDTQYTSVPCLTQKLSNCAVQLDAPPAAPAHDEIAPFLPHLEHRESSV